MSEENKEEFPDYIGDLDKLVGGLANIPGKGPFTGNADRMLEKIRKTFPSNHEQQLIDRIRNGSYSRAKPTEKGWTTEIPIPGTLPAELVELLRVHPPVNEDGLLSIMEPENIQWPLIIGNVLPFTVYCDKKFPNNQIKVSDLMSDQDKPKNLCEETAIPAEETKTDAANLHELIAKTKARMEVANADAVKELSAIIDAYKAKTTQPAKDPNWVPPWEDLPGSQPAFREVNLTTTLPRMDVSKLNSELLEREPGTIGANSAICEIIPGMLSKIHQELKLTRFLGTHSPHHDLPEATNYEDGAFFAIQEKYELCVVDNGKWETHAVPSREVTISYTAEEWMELAKKITSVRIPHIWGELPTEGEIKPPIFSDALNDAAEAEAFRQRLAEQGDKVPEVFFPTVHISPEALMADTGMSAKELVESSSVNDAVAQIQEGAQILRDAGILTNGGIEGLVTIAQTENEITLDFPEVRHPLDHGDMSVKDIPPAMPLSRTTDEPLEVKPAALREEEPTKTQQFADEADKPGEVRTELLEENIRKTVVPIPTDLIREFFTNKNIFYFINYSQSKLKGNAFLTYLTNLAVPADVGFDDGITYEEYSEIMKAYLDQNSITEAASLNVMAAEMLLFAKGMPYEHSPYALPIGPEILTRFINENKEQVDRWLHFLDSTQVFALSAINLLKAHYHPAEFFEVIEDKDYVGANIAQLYRVPEFIAYYFSIQDAKYKLSYFKPQYEEYMFKNERLAKYFRSKNNYAALMFEHLAMGTFKASDVGLGIFAIGVFDPAAGIPEYDASHLAPTDKKE